MRKSVLLLSAIAVALSSHAETVFRSFEYSGNDDYYNANPLDGNGFYNPVIAGWASDPSVVRHGDDYWLVTSTFGYYPGVPLYHSNDLVNWRLVRNILDRPSQLDGLRGQSLDKGGIYAPHISYNPANGLFYMVTTDTGRKLPHFYVTATDPAGDWSDPVYLNGIDGIDPSFFFDDNGEAYIVFKEDTAGKPRTGATRFIRFIRFDVASGNTVGESWPLNEQGVSPDDRFARSEGPHIYKIDGLYYLLTAEGGTGTNHSANIYRANNIRGPWLRSGRNPILTQRLLKPTRSNPVTCSGHADFVQTPQGDWFAVFLACRPGPGNFQALGRETFLMPVRWSTDRWPFITQGEDTVPLRIDRPGMVRRDDSQQSGNFTWSDDFSGKTLRPEWLSLRGDASPYYSLGKKGLVMKPSPDNSSSKGVPAFLGRRIQHHKFSANTTITKLPSANERSGLLIVRNENAQYFLAADRDKVSLIRIERKGRETLAEAPHNTPAALTKKPQNVPAGLTLRIDSDGKALRFSFRTAKSDWQTLADSIDASHISCDRTGGFTGTTLGPYTEPL